MVIVTNQSGFARGILTQEQYEAVQARVLEVSGPGTIDATYMCPDFGPRRKPSPAMILEAARDLNIDLSRSCMVGDKAIDVFCGRNAGTKTIFVQTGYAMDSSCEPDFVAANMTEAVNWILHEMQDARGIDPTRTKPRGMPAFTNFRRARLDMRPRPFLIYPSA